MFADKETAARRADTNAAAWKEAQASVKVTSGFCLFIALGLAFVAVYLAGYVAGLCPPIL